MIKIGLLGLGAMGTTHANAYEALKGKIDFKITAITDEDKAKTAKFAALTGAVIYDSADELFEKANVNTVDICLPTFLHFEYAYKAVQKGLNVFIEKPLCSTSADAYKLAEAAEKQNIFTQVGHCIRFWDEYEYLRKVYKSREFGSLLHAKFRRLSPRPEWAWNNWYMQTNLSGGALFELHIHDADYMLSLFGEPKKIHAFANDAKEKLSSVIINCEYDTFTVMLEGSWNYSLSFPFEMSFIASFEKATITYSSIHGIKVYPEKGDNYVPVIEKFCTVTSDKVANISSLGAYYNQLHYFLQCISTGKKPEKATFLDGAKTVEFIEKEKASLG